LSYAPSENTRSGQYHHVTIMISYRIPTFTSNNKEKQKVLSYVSRTILWPPPEVNEVKPNVNALGVHPQLDHNIHTKLGLGFIHNGILKFFQWLVHWRLLVDTSLILGNGNPSIGGLLHTIWLMCCFSSSCNDQKPPIWSF
jgi:hypothetical protein